MFHLFFSKITIRHIPLYRFLKIVLLYRILNIEFIVTKTISACLGYLDLISLIITKKALSAPHLFQMNIWNESDKLWTLLWPVATKCPLCLVLLSCTKVKFMNSLYVARMFPTLHRSIMMGRQNMYQYINIWHFASVMLCMCIILPYCPLTSLLIIQNKWRWQLQWNISFQVKIGWTKLYISPLLLFDLGLCFIHNPLPTLSYTLMPVAFLAQNKLRLVGFWTVGEQGNCHSQVPGSMETVTFN